MFAFNEKIVFFNSARYTGGSGVRFDILAKWNITMMVKLILEH